MQVEGINSLVRVLQEVRDKNPAQAPRRSSMPSVLPGQVQEAINMLQWFVREVQTLSPYARNEALRRVSVLSHFWSESKSCILSMNKTHLCHCFS